MGEYTNPHFEVIKKLLFGLVGHDNDTVLINTQLRALQARYDAEMEAVADRCTKLRKSVKDNNFDPKGFTDHMNSIDKVRELYADKIKVLSVAKDKIYAAANRCFATYNAAKCEYNKFYERSVNHFKCVAINSTDPQAILDIEKKINDMNKLYLSEVEFIKRIEYDLGLFLKQLKNDVQTTEVCFSRDYAYVPKGKGLDAVQALADEMKISNLPALRQALAQAHVYQPADIKSFVAAYLLHMDKCEQATKEKAKLGLRQTLTK